MMEYQKTINLLDDTPSQISKFRTKNWFKMMTHMKRVIPTVKLSLRPSC